MRQMTQAELAGSDFSKGFVSLVESGRTRMSLRAAGILASRLDLSLGVLLGESPLTDTSLESALTEALRRSEELERYAERTQIEVRAALEMVRRARTSPARRTAQRRSQA
jgi:hypothetical protein